MTIDWQGLWNALNEHQRHFLTRLYNADQDRTAHYRRERFMFDPIQKEAEWRWIDINGIVQLPIGGDVRQSKREIAANVLLEEMGYLEQRWKFKDYRTFDGIRTVNVYSVRLTRRGRQLARTILEGPPVRKVKTEMPAAAVQEADPEAERREARQRLGEAFKAKRGTRMLRDVAWEMGEMKIGVVGTSALSCIEHGKRVDMETVWKVCDWMGVSLDDFFGEGTMAEVAWNPDGFVCVPLRAGGHTHVAPDAPPELLEALNRLADQVCAEAARRHEAGEAFP